MHEMHSPLLAKKWWIVEVQLRQASEFLYQPVLFRLPKQEFSEYRFNLRQDELKHAMTHLESLAKDGGAKSGFWRRIKKAAESIGDNEKAVEYEREFQNALSKSA